MAKAWEETWIVDAGDVVRSDDGGCVFEQSYTGSLPDQPDRVLLASAAPDLVRVLLAVEWPDHGEGAACPSCDSFRPDERLPRGYRQGHLDCALDAALRKAGLPPEAREAARAEIAKAGAR